MISFASPLAQYRSHKSAIDEGVSRVLESGNYILGEHVAGFESRFAEYCGGAHAIGVGSGTDAITLAIKALGLAPGEEVITVSHTALATVAAVLAADAVPVLVDVDPVYYTLDPSALDRAVTVRTRAIVAVHLYGQASDMEAIAAFASRNGLTLIEDCAQAAGGTLNGRRLGGIGDIGCFSFFPTKNLGAIGDGGAVVTSDKRVADAVRRLRQYGWDERRVTHGIGLNSRLDEIQAAILAAKLPTLDAGNARRSAFAARYSAGLAGLPISVPAVRVGSRHVFHLYVIACDRREALRAHLASSGIDTGIHYPVPVHRQHGYADRVRVIGSLDSTERLAAQVLSLPIYPELPDDDVDRVIAAVRDFF